MADLSFSQSADPVEIFDSATGNKLAPNSDGSINDNLSKVGGVAVALGQAVMASSIPVVIASNQTSIPVTTEGAKATYSAAFTGLTLPATPTDIFTVLGSATKTIRITRIALTISTTAGSGIVSNISLIKRSTADSAGTSTTATLVPLDSNNAAATSVVRGYTANPTLGTAVGTLRAVRFNTTAAGTLGSEIVLDFGTRPAQSLVLRGASEQICVNFGSTTITGGIASFSVEWTEE